MIKSRSTRLQNCCIGDSYDRNLNSHNFIAAAPAYSRFERVDSSNHPDYLVLDDGGGFFDHQLSESRYTPGPVVQVSAIAGGGNPFLSYTGAFVASKPASSMPLGDGTQWGAIAYQKMKPTKYDYSLFNMVYELKDLPGMLLSLNHFWSLDMFKRAGGLWSGTGRRVLEHEFGWSPLVDDVLTLINKQQTIQKRIDWLIRNQGKWLHRKTTVFHNKSTTVGDWVQDYGAYYPVLTTQHYINVPEYSDVIMQSDKCWATAQFKYFLPEVGPGVKLPLVVKRAMQGFHAVTMEELYKAIPWSWLVDWCLGIGRILQNCDPGIADRIAARRFYIMREMEVVKIRRARGVMRGFGGASDVPINVSSWQRDLHQTRVVGSPFYPGNPNNLSGMQLAILGALGASRL